MVVGFLFGLIDSGRERKRDGEKKKEEEEEGNKTKKQLYGMGRGMERKGEVQPFFVFLFFLFFLK